MLTDFSYRSLECEAVKCPIGSQCPHGSADHEKCPAGKQAPREGKLLNFLKIFYKGYEASLTQVYTLHSTHYTAHSVANVSCFSSDVLFFCRSCFWLLKLTHANTPLYIYHSVSLILFLPLSLSLSLSLSLCISLSLLLSLCLCLSVSASVSLFLSLSI